MHRSLIAAVLALVLAAVPLEAQAKQPPAGTLTFDGTTLVGLPVTAYSFGVTNTTDPGSGGGGGAGKATFSAVTVARSTDAASPLLVRAVATGEHFPIAVLVLTNEGTAVTIRLEDVAVTGVQQSGTAEVTESVSLRFRKITMTVGANTVTWDIAENRGG